MVFLTQPVAEVVCPTFRPQLGILSTARIIIGPVIRRTMLPIPLFLNLLGIGLQAPQLLNGRHRSHTITLRARTLRLPQTLPARATRQNPFISTSRISTFPFFLLHSTQRKVESVLQIQLRKIVPNLVRLADMKHFLLEVKPAPRTPSLDPQNTSGINVEALLLRQRIIIDISAVIAMMPATNHPQSTCPQSRLQFHVAQQTTARTRAPTSLQPHQSPASSATTSTPTATEPRPPPNHPPLSPSTPNSASSPRQAETHPANEAVTAAAERHYSSDEPSARTGAAGATTGKEARAWTAADARTERLST